MELLFVQARLSRVAFHLRVKDEENIVRKQSQVFVHLPGFFYFKEIMNLNQPLSAQFFFIFNPVGAVVCSSTGHDIFSHPHCFLPKSPKTNKIYFLYTF